MVLFLNVSSLATMSQSVRTGSLFIAVRFLALVCCCNAITIGDKNAFCLLVRSEHGTSEVSFLTHRLDASASLRFHWSKWTRGRSVEDCFVSTDETLIHRYVSLCERQQRARDAAETSPYFNLSVILADDRLCEFKTRSSFTLSHGGVKPRQRTDPSVKRRQKRALILPGTLWCGRGSSANDYEQLGMFEHADRCCREHDHCQHIIRAFSVNYGVFNPTLFTVSHCDCDHRFKQCLLNGNDTISNMVGYSFFNVLKIRCFELSQRKRCTQFNWFGTCISVQLTPVAVLQDSTPYNSTNLSNEKTDPSCNEAPIESSHNDKRRTSKSKQTSWHRDQKDCAPVKHAKGDTFQLTPALENKYDKKKKIQTVKPRKERKMMQPNTFMNFSLPPPTDTFIMRQRTALKHRLEAVLQSIERKTKASVTRSPASASESKPLWIQSKSEQTSGTKSRARTLQGKKNKVKTRSRSAVKSRQSKKCKPKNSLFQPSKAEDNRPKHHSAKNVYLQRMRCSHPN